MLVVVTNGLRRPEASLFDTSEEYKALHVDIDRRSKIDRPLRARWGPLGE